MYKPGYTRKITSIVCVIAMIFTFCSVVQATSSFNTNLTWSYPSGWTEVSGGLQGDTSMWCVSNESGTDFTLEGDIDTSTGQQAGLAFRSAANPADGSYVVFLQTPYDTVDLQRIYTGGGAMISSVGRTLAANTVYHIKVVAEGTNIKVYFNNETTPLIDVNDSNYSGGKFALQRAGGPAVFNNVTSTTVSASRFNTNLTWSYPAGWTEVSGGLQGDTSMWCVSNESGTDFTLEGDIDTSTGQQVGLAFRSSENPSDGSYVVFLQTPYDTVDLQRIYIGGGAMISSVGRTLETNTVYHIKVVTEGTNIKVYFNNETTPLIDVNDSNYSGGKFALQRAGGPAVFNNVTSFIVRDDFNDGDLAGWTTINGVWTNPGTAAQGVSADNGFILREETAANIIFDADIKLNTAGSAGILVFRSNSNAGNSYAVALDTAGSVVKLYKFPYVPLQSYNQAFVTNTWYHLKVVANGDNIKVYFNNSPTACIDFNDSSYTSGQFGLASWGGTIQFDNVEVSGSSTSSGTVNLLSSQLGYETESSKLAYIRDLNMIDPGTSFTVVNSGNDQTVYTGAIEYWGQKWGSNWWKLDFSSFKTPGTYYLSAGGTISNSFNIGDNVLMNYDMVAIALDQLDARNNHGTPNTYNLDGSLRYTGRWLMPNGSYPEGIFRDCSSNFAEIESVGMTVMGLLDLYNYQLDKFSMTDQQRIKDYIVQGTDYIMACQRDTSDPSTNGRFAHSILVNTMDNCAWAGNVYTWHDMAYAMTVLTNAYKVVNQFDSLKAAAYLIAAEKAYDCATYRPYHIASEYNLATQVSSFDPNTDYATPLWSPNVPGYTTNPNSIPSGWNNRADFTRRFYNKPSTWNEPTTLKTREKLPFLWACTLLYEITGGAEYLDKAVEFADSIQDRQFVDWQNTIEGVYGNFYEFEGDNDAFSIESGQAGSYHMGNIDALNVNGFIELLKLQPEHPNAAKWYNVVKTYADSYVKNAALLNPLGIQPVSLYEDPTYGGVKFFANLLHGAMGHYGLSAVNMLELGNFLNDKSFMDLATANMQMYTGLNPGIPNGTDKWTAATMINQVGPSYYNTGGEGIKGGVVNGFKTGANWTLYNINEISDEPDLASGQEDWVAHSHPYVSAVARIESNYDLTVRTYDNGSPVNANVSITLPESYNYSTGLSGSTDLTDLPLNRAGTITVTYGNRTISKHLETIGGGKLIWDVDFAQYVDMALTLPGNIALNGTGTATLTVTNRGSGTVSNTINLSSSGVLLGSSEISINVASGGSQDYNFNVTGGTTVMSYAVYASLDLGANKLFTAANQGLVGN